MHVGIANPRWREKRSQHSRLMPIPHYYVSGKRPIEYTSVWICTIIPKCHKWPTRERGGAAHGVAAGSWLLKVVAESALMVLVGREFHSGLVLVTNENRKVFFLRWKLPELVLVLSGWSGVAGNVQFSVVHSNLKVVNLVQKCEAKVSASVR